MGYSCQTPNGAYVLLCTAKRHAWPSMRCCVLPDDMPGNDLLQQGAEA